MKYKVKKAFAHYKPGDLIIVNDTIMANRLKAAGRIVDYKPPRRKKK